MLGCGGGFFYECSILWCGLVHADNCPIHLLNPSSRLCPGRSNLIDQRCCPAGNLQQFCYRSLRCLTPLSTELYSLT